MLRWKVPREEVEVTWCERLRRSVLVMLLMSMLVVVASRPASAEEEKRIEVTLMVSRISDGPGGIDPRAGRLHQKLKSQFRYESLNVLQIHSLTLRIDQVGTELLPNGKKVRIRPLQLDDEGALLAVDVEGAVRGDYKLRNGHLLVFGAGQDGDGKLVISLEPHW
ncbi:MAG: hypothetical protein E2O66_03240 [Deltaproteobacteria bacterium]|nr:MAG: hypothetical protein E2O66_03240 [Deltaproteobacteria bacterium]